MDLSLVPIEELMKEAEGRCHCFVAAYEEYQDKRKTMQFKFGKGDWFDAVRLTAILHNDVMNDWNGELQTLQRINKEDLI